MKNTTEENTKTKRWLALATIVILLGVLGVPEAVAQTARGATVQVQLKDSRVIAGEFLAVRDGALVILEKNSGIEFTANFADTAVVRKFGKSNTLGGILLGGAWGAATAWAWTASSHEARGWFGLVGMVSIPICGLIGGIIGGSVRFRTEFQTEGKNPEDFKRFLEGIRRYSREGKNGRQIAPHSAEKSTANREFQIQIPEITDASPTQDPPSSDAKESPIMWGLVISPPSQRMGQKGFSCSLRIGLRF